MNNFIVILDPSLKDHQQNESTNLGDLIIYESVSKYLKELFPSKEILRLTTHSYLKREHLNLINKADLTVFGGTNALSSNIQHYHQWKLSHEKLFYLFPKVKNILLLGVGWWQYQSSPDFFTRNFYRQVLNKNFFHSVRDEYTENKLLYMGFKNVVNTSCPTTWELNGKNGNRRSLSINNCVFMLTDYKPNPVLDTKLISTILEYYLGRIYFFPQGISDIEYINSLEIFKSNRYRIEILDRTFQSFNSCIKNGNINYIGTRLHGGIKCLQENIDSLIISIDNRATEIGKDINLPVLSLDDNYNLRQWIEGKKIFKNINLPIESINMWKSQFKDINK